MEEKKTIKISISTFFLMLSIIAICVMGFYIYKLNDKNTNSSFELNGTYEWTNPYGEGIICTFSNGTFTLESTWNYKGTYVISGNKVILKTHFLKQLKETKGFGLYMKNVHKFYLFDTSANIKDLLIKNFGLTEDDYEVTDDEHKPFDEIDSGKAEASILSF